MEKEIIESKTICAVGIIQFTALCKQAQREGWELLGEPMMTGQIINQVVIKYKS